MKEFNDASTPEQTEHELLKEILYYGEKKEAGARVTLYADQVERLRQQGIIE